MTVTLTPPDAVRAAASRRAEALAGNGLAALSMVIWAAGFLAAEALLQSWPPTLLVPARFVVAMAFLAPIWLLREGLPRGLPWARGMAAGAVGIGGGAILLVYAQDLTDPVTAAVFASVSPMTGTLVEVAYRERRLSRAFAWGIAASVAGGVIATAGSGLGTQGLVVGAGISVVSCLLYSWGSHETVRLMPGRSALTRTSVTLTGAMLVTCALGATSLLAGQAVLPAVGWGDLGQLAIYGIGGMALSQLLFVAAIGRIGVALSSFHINIAPFYVMLFLAALGGGWSWAQALGAAVVALGVVIAQRG